MKRIKSQKTLEKEHNYNMYIKKIVEEQDQLSIYVEKFKRVKKLDKIISSQKNQISNASVMVTEKDVENKYHKVSAFAVSSKKLMTYKHKDAQGMNIINGKKKFFFKPQYQEFQLEIENDLEKQIEEILKAIPNKKEEFKKIKFKIGFYTVEQQHYTDNLLKPFFDILFRRLGDRKDYDDSQIWKIEFCKRHSNNPNKKERIFFEIHKITDSKLEKDDLIYEYDHKAKIRKIQEYNLPDNEAYLFNNTNDCFNDIVEEKIEVINKQRKMLQHILTMFDFEEEKKESKTFKIIFDKLISYNDCTEVKLLPNNDIEHVETKEWIEYRNHINKKLEKNLEELKKSIPSKPFKIKSSFYVDYEQKDLDNILIPFYKVLLEFLEKHKIAYQNDIFSLESVKRKTAMTSIKKERIYFKFEEAIEDQSDMLHRFNKWCDSQL